MGACSVNIPSLVVSGGPMLTGKYMGRDIGTSDVWRFDNAVRSGEMSEEELRVDMHFLYNLWLDLRQKAGQDIAKQLIAKSDILIENFRPGTLEKWGLSPEALHAINPGLIIVRVSGYGQTGPYADRAGFAGYSVSNWAEDHAEGRFHVARAFTRDRSKSHA